MACLGEFSAGVRWQEDPWRWPATDLRVGAVYQGGPVPEQSAVCSDDRRPGRERDHRGVSLPARSRPRMTIMTGSKDLPAAPTVEPHPSTKPPRQGRQDFPGLAAHSLQTIDRGTARSSRWPWSREGLVSHACVAARRAPSRGGPGEPASELLPAAGQHLARMAFRDATWPRRTPLRAARPDGSAATLAITTNGKDHRSPSGQRGSEAVAAGVLVPDRRRRNLARTTGAARPSYSQAGNPTKRRRPPLAEERKSPAEIATERGHCQ